MMDDPLALAVQMIAVLAAGMYPVGFLFGVCSDCCGCPPCSRCTHFANNGNECPTSGVDWTVTLGEYAPQTLALNLGDYENTGIVIPLEDIPELPELPNTSGEWTYAMLSAIISDVPRLSDSCGCESCLYGVGFRAELGFDNDGFLLYGRSLTADESLDGCSDDGSAITFSPNAGWAFVEGGPSGYELETNAQDVLDWLNGLGLTVSMQIDPCECGACCEEVGTGITCSDNVAEGACPGDWQGVDTLCEDVTCGGTCCDAATGNCTYTLEEQCAGTWTAGGECEPNPCPQPPEGACCDAATGDCSQTIEINCPGEWSEGVECDPNPCPQPPTGACCQDGNCTETTQADCAGAWLEGVDCDPNPCTLGACCDPFGGCAENVRQDECNAYSQWISGQTCEESDCPPAGTCCEYIDGVFDLSNNFTEYACDQTQALLGIDTVWQPGEDGECPPTNP
jgi:hypothetical protein